MTRGPEQITLVVLRMTPYIYGTRADGIPPAAARERDNVPASTHPIATEPEIATQVD